MPDELKTLHFSFEGCDTDEEKIHVITAAILEIAEAMSDGEELDLCETLQGVMAGCVAAQIEEGHIACVKGWLDRAVEMFSRNYNLRPH